MEELLLEIPVSDGIRTLIGGSVILLLTLIVIFIVRHILIGLIGKFTQRTKTSLDDYLITAIKGRFSLLILILGIEVLVKFLQLRYQDVVGVTIFTIAGKVLFAIGVIIVAILFVRVTTAILKWYREFSRSREDAKFDNEFVPLVDRTIKILIFILGSLIILDHFAVDVKGLIAVLGVGSLAVALAAQETLANMIGGFTIMIDRPFRVGDMVLLPDGRRVTVHEIGIRSTKFLTYDNTLVIVPNSELIKSTVHNITYPEPKVRIVINVGVSYDSDMVHVKKVVLEEANKHPKTIKDPVPEFYFLNFGDSSLDVSLRCQVANTLDYRITSSELREMILNRFREEKIEIPFPQRVVTMVSESKSDKIE